MRLAVEILPTFLQVDKPHRLEIPPVATKAEQHKVATTKVVPRKAEQYKVVATKAE
mgnify:CR=1 FL=1